MDDSQVARLTRFSGAGQPSPRSRGSRPARLNVVIFDGTWAGGITSSKSTICALLYNLIAAEENRAEIYMPGVGTGGGVYDKFRGGLTGWGFTRSFMKAFKSLARGYQVGDRIIIIGYSRGACAARVLAALIGLLGLPIDGTNELYKKVARKAEAGRLWHVDGIVDKIMHGCSRYAYVPIQALVLFDTVGTLGIPFPGINALCKNKYNHYNNVVSVPPSNVHSICHIIALQEFRKPYAVEIVLLPEDDPRRPRFKQVYVPGGHGNLGWDSGQNGLVNVPLACAIGFLHHVNGIRFNDEKLSGRFPCYVWTPELEQRLHQITPMPSSGADHAVICPGISNNDTSSVGTSVPQLSTESVPSDRLLPAWIFDKVPSPNYIEVCLGGWEARKPGSNSKSGYVTNETIHVTGRLRLYGDLPQIPSVVPGYVARETRDDAWMWVKEVKDRSSSRKSRMQGPSESSSNEASGCIDEDAMFPIEAELLGLGQWQRKSATFSTAVSFVGSTIEE